MVFKVTAVFVKKLVKTPLPVLNALDEDDIALILQTANQKYHTLGKPIIPDDIYDMVKLHLQKMNPKHPVLRNVGAVIEDSDSRREKLPMYMGSMDKIKTEASSFNNFKEKYTTFVISDKLDGVSALFQVTNGQQKLFTRGDGTHGQNISHLIPFLPSLNSLRFKKDEDILVRGELIMTRAAFETVQDQGANARNMVAGLANAKVPSLKLLKLVDFMSYSLIKPDNVNQLKQFDKLKRYGFKVVYHKALPHAKLNVDHLSTLLIARRAASPFEVDGIIVSDGSEYHQVLVGKNPTYAFAFKSVLTQEVAEVVVTNVDLESL